MAREVSKWITVNGNHVPIYEGESKADVRKRIEQLGSKSESGKKSSSAKSEKAAKKDSGNFDHDKAVEFFAKKEGISKEKAANMVKNLGEERVKRMMEKGDTKKTEHKSEPSKFNVEDYKKKTASDSDFYAKVAGIKSKKMVEKERAEAAKETKIDGANTISKKDFVKKYAEEYGMDADDFKQKGKDIKNFIIPEDDENPYIGVEYSDGTFWRYGTGRDLEVTKKELQDSLGKSTQQDKDERTKQKQIANANKQKDDLNEQMSSKEESVFTVAQDVEKNGKATTKSEKIAKAYKSNGSYAVTENADGSYNIMKKGSDAHKAALADSAEKKLAEKKSEKVVDFGNGEAIKKRNESIIEYNGVKMPRKDADDIDYLKKELSFLSDRAAHLKVHMGKTLSEKELKEREDLQNQLRKYKKKYPDISIGRYLPGGK